jgi:riboflavin kinase/FMN adenylyltransferase
MRKFYSLDQLSKETFDGCVLSIGMFDGVHLGHKQVIDTCCNIAQKDNLKSVLITFSNHPSEYLATNNHVQLLSTLDEKIKHLSKSKLDILVILPFDLQMASLSAKEFTENILLEKFNCKVIVFGYDNHFGKNRQGSPKYINLNYGELINTIVVKEEKIESEIISSSRIKELIDIGNISLANQFLGYNYTLHSIVVHGNKLGRLIGFPTANYDLTNNAKILPSCGVYLTKNYVETSDGIVIKIGLTNVGYRPTISNTSILAIETNLFDFDSDIYGCPIESEFICRIRSERKFNSLDELKNQIMKDKMNALAILTKIHVAT